MVGAVTKDLQRTGQLVGKVENFDQRDFDLVGDDHVGRGDGVEFRQLQHGSRQVES